MNFASRRPKANTKTKHMYVAVLSTAALFSVGCSSSPKQTGPNAVRGNWAYTPDTVEVHPLSRFTTAEQQGKTAVVVHIEFKDGDDFVCRGTGTLSVTAATKNGVVFDSKQIDLANTRVNYDTFDAVTRTYHVLFSSVPIDCKLVVVEATYVEPAGAKMKSGKHTIKNYR